MDALAALKLQVEWGADEALEAAPLQRLRMPPQASPALDSPPLVPSSVAPPPASRPAATRAGTAASRAAALAASAQDLEALEAALAGFDECALRDTATRLVFAAGEGAAGIMAVGDVPGPDEDRAGAPFAGAPGRYLDQMLASIGLDRGDVRLTVLVPWRPPGGRPATESEVALCLPFLLRHIALARPRRLLLLGPLAARTLIPVGPAGRRKPRGGWTDIAVPDLPAPVPALVLGSPAALLASPAGRREAWAGLRLLRRALDQDAQRAPSAPG